MLFLLRMSFFLKAATVLSAYYASLLYIFLSEGSNCITAIVCPADGLIEMDFRGNMLTGNLSASLARLPIVVRALCVCPSHCSLSTSTVGTVCSICCLCLKCSWHQMTSCISHQLQAQLAMPCDSQRPIHTYTNP